MSQFVTAFKTVVHSTHYFIRNRNTPDNTLFYIFQLFADALKNHSLVDSLVIYKFSLSSGVPQGYIVGLLFFVMYNNEIGKKLVLLKIM